jgi:multiple sugar transport system substrate-binding protein
MYRKSLSRRDFLALTASAAAGTLLAACGQAAPTAAPAAPAATNTPAAAAPSPTDTPVAAAPAAEAKVYEAWYQHTGIDEEAIKEIIDKYNAEQAKGGVTVKAVYIPATTGTQSNERLLTAIAGGTPPATNLFDRFIVAQFAQQGFLTNIADMAKAAGVTADQFFPFAWEETVYKDGIYALPFDTDTRALWYNKDIFTEAGLDPEKPPTNFTELKQFTEKLTIRDAQKRITRYGLNPLYDQAWAYTWGFAWKGLFQDPQTKKITCSNPQVVQSMVEVKKFVDEIGVEDIDAMITACQGTACNDANDYFWTGQTAMTVSGNWRVAQSHRFKPDVKYGVVPLPGPEGPAPYASWAGGWSWVVPSGVKDVATCFDIVNYICGPTGQDIYNKKTFHIPTNKKSAEDPFYRADPLHAVFMDLLPVSHTRPPIPAGSLLWDELFQAFRDDIPHGKKTPEQAMKDIDDKVNARLQELGFFS